MIDIEEFKKKINTLERCSFGIDGMIEIDSDGEYIEYKALIQMIESIDFTKEISEYPSPEPISLNDKVSVVAGDNVGIKCPICMSKGSMVELQYSSVAVSGDEPNEAYISCPNCLNRYPMSLFRNP